MKKLTLLFVILFLVAGILDADITQYYAFNQFTGGSYTVINGNLVTGINTDNALSAAIPLGFVFQYGQAAYSQIKVSSNGWIALGTNQTATGQLNQLSSMVNCPVLAPYWDDLNCTNTSVSYVVLGNAPFRTFTVQFANAHHQGGTDNLNFQVKLYESGMLEFTYGETTGWVGGTASIGINMMPGGATNYWSITPGTPSSVSSTAENNAVSTWPGLGTSYIFNPLTGNVVELMLGTGGEQARVPLDFYFMNSLYETIIPESEINQGGVITNISLYNNFVSTLWDKPIKIWMGVTNLTDLSAGWIPATQLTQVFAGNVSFPSGANTISIPLSIPYTYWGSNLVLMFEREMDIEYYNLADNFYGETIGTNRSRNVYGDTTDYDAANPPQNSTLSGKIPQLGLRFYSGNMGVLQGTVTLGGAGLGGVTVTLNNIAGVETTSATGAYHFPYVQPGSYNVTFAKLGFVTQTVNVVVTANQTSTVNVVMTPAPVVTVTGTVVGSDAPGTGLANAAVSLNGTGIFGGVTNAQGQYTITGVSAGATYTYMISKAGYQNATGTIVIGTTNYTMNTITLIELALPVANVLAVQNPTHTQVNVTWESSGALEGEWIQWDDNIFENSIGTNIAADFDIASRWTAADLLDYAGQSLYSVKFFPTTADCVYSIRVWTGGSANAPGTMVVDQIVSNPTINTFNTVTLNAPVLIPAGQELWFGVRCNVSSGYPAGADAGPAHEGLGNMICYNGVWSTLTDIVPVLSYNWNLAGFVSFLAPTRLTRTIPLTSNAERICTGNLGFRRASSSIPDYNTTLHENDRAFLGYKVWRLLQGQENNEQVWTQLTPEIITPNNYTDTGWTTLLSGQYKWAVKAMYTNNVASLAQFSNPVSRFTQEGTIAGIVHGPNNSPIAGAEVTAGTSSVTTSAAGTYSMLVPQGTYTVTVTRTGYANGSQAGVVVTTGQTTTVNFALTLSLVVEDGFETYSNFSLAFPPWVTLDVDQSTTYAYSGYQWPNTTMAQAFMIFTPSATTPPSTTEIGAPHSGNKMAACWAANTTQNNDWLISPAYTAGIGASVSFYAKSMTSQYGLERFKVGYSTGSVTPGDFTIISGTNYVEAPINWTLYTYTLPVGIVGTVRIGIQCVSNDAYCFMVDDFGMDLGSTGNTIEVSGTVYSSDAPTVGLANASVQLNGLVNHFGITNTQGHFLIPGVLPSRTYSYSVTKPGYQMAVGTLVTDTTNIQMENITLVELALPVPWVNALENATHSAINLTWSAPLPSAGPEFLSSENPVLSRSKADSGFTRSNQNADLPGSSNAYRNLLGYKIWRLVAGQEQMELAWTQLTSNPIAALSYSDPSWTDLPDGQFRWAVKAIYTNGVMSPASFSNTVPMISWGALNGTVTCNGTGLSGVSVTISNTSYAQVTATDGTYGFPFIPAGTYSVSFCKAGYYTQIQSVVVTENQATVCNPVLVLIPVSNITGTVVGSDAPTVGLTNAYIIMTGVQTYQGYTNAQGQFNLTGVLSGHTYAYTVMKPGYQMASGSLVVVMGNYDLNTIILQEIIYPASEVVAIENAGHTCVNIAWDAPGVPAINSSKNRLHNSVLKPEDENRAFIGYKLWRLMAGQEEDETSWDLLTQNTITNTSYADTAWANIPYQSFKWAVKAVYSNNIMSIPAFSGLVTHVNLIGCLSGTVRTAAGTPISGATVRAGMYTATTNVLGAYALQVIAGTYTVSATQNGYNASIQNNVVVVVGQTSTLNFHLTSVGNEDNNNPLPATELIGCYPNPFQSNTTISYSVKSNVSLSLEIFNISGQKVRSLVNGTRAQGNFDIVWDGKDDSGIPVTSGIYFYKMNAGKYSASRKMILLK